MHKGRESIRSVHYTGKPTKLQKEGNSQTKEVQMLQRQKSDSYPIVEIDTSSACGTYSNGIINRIINTMKKQKKGMGYLETGTGMSQAVVD